MTAQLVLVHDHASARDLLHGREWCRLGYETTLHRRPEGFAVRHFRTDIITYYPDGTARLDTGGWYSRTTFDRIRQLAAPVYQYHGEPWLMRHGAPLVPFYDGMVIGRTTGL